MSDNKTQLGGRDLTSTKRSVLTKVGQYLPYVVGLALAFLLVDPNGKKWLNLFWDAVDNYCLIFLAALVTIWFSTWFFSKRARAYRKHPKFFEEMKSALSSILTPLGFEEKEVIAYDTVRHVIFSQDKLRVVLWVGAHDSYYVDATSKYSPEEIQSVFAACTTKAEKDALEDFSVGGTIFEPDKFKSEATAQLNRWLAEQGEDVHRQLV